MCIRDRHTVTRWQKKKQLLRLFSTQELIPALIRADTGYQLLTFPRFGVRELFLDRSVIEPIKYGIVYLMTVRALSSHSSITLPHSKQSPTLRYSTLVPFLTASL